MTETTLWADCVWEHNGDDSLLYAVDWPGAYTRGASAEAAILGMADEIAAYLRWVGEVPPAQIAVRIVQEKVSTLAIRDADSDVIFDAERAPMTFDEYARGKALACKSAADFLALYRAVPDPGLPLRRARETFYGSIPRTAAEMYAHTLSVNAYYFGELGAAADNAGDILSCRCRGFAALEAQADFPAPAVRCGSFGEEWSLRKLLRRFIWHDRIHARALWRRCSARFGPMPDPFCFGLPPACAGGAVANTITNNREDEKQ